MMLVLLVELAELHRLVLMLQLQEARQDLVMKLTNLCLGLVLVVILILMEVQEVFHAGLIAYHTQEPNIVLVEKGAVVIWEVVEVQLIQIQQQ